MQTLQSLFTNRFVVSSLIALVLAFGALSVIPSFATAQETPPEQVPVQECDPGYHLDGEDCVEDAPVEAFTVVDNEEDKVTICHVPPGNPENSETLEVDENGWNGHDGHELDSLGACNDDEDEDEDEDEDDVQCVIVSDEVTLEGGDSAVPVSFIHEAWNSVTALLSNATWIWGEDPVAPSDTEKTEVFTREFSLGEDFDDAELEVSADNGFKLVVNGSEVDDRLDESNYGSVQTYDITSYLVEGNNTLEFTVKNFAQDGGTPESNPAGLIYRLSIEEGECGDPIPPVENSCVAPSSEGGSEEIEIGNAPGQEDELEEILDEEGYSVDAEDDQVNTQAWLGTGNTVEFIVENTAKNAAHSHVFGYYLNGGDFVPVFRNGTVGAPLDGVTALALGDTISFEVEGVNDIVFAIADWNGSSYTYYATDKTMNPSGDDHAIVYNPESDEYVIAFEDLPLAGDHDYNDIVVTLQVDDCRDVPTANIHTTKIVCSDEQYLPNWGDGSGERPITEDTADNFLVEVNEGHEEPVCWVEKWQFEWATPGTNNPGDNLENGGEGWNTFSGSVNLTADAWGDAGYVWIRETLPEGYIPFSGDTAGDPWDDVSAEVYCNVDVLNYDNYDRVDNMEEGEDYYCVAWNVEVESEPVCESEGNLLSNGGFELPAISLSDWDIVPSGTTGLEWLVEWNNPSDAPDIANAEFHRNVSGWLPAEGLQYAELDSDWTGHTGSNGEAGAVSMSQTVATVPGVEYTFSFKFSPRPNTAEAENRVEALADGNVIGSTPDLTGGGNTSWTEYSFTYVAENTTTTFALRDADGNPNNSVGSFVDDASVRCDVVNEVPTTITVTKIVAGETNYGVGNFPLFVDDTSVVSGVATEVEPGSYTVHETGNPYFEATFSGEDCVADETNETRYNNVQDWLAKKNALQEAIDAEEGDTEDDAVRAAMIVDINDKIAALLNAITATVTVAEGESAECTITNTYTPTWETDLTQCFDGVSNDSDGLVDAEDPGCHTDGNPENPLSYDPNDNDEDNGGDNESTGTFTIVKHAYGSNENYYDGSFTFTIDTENEDSEDMISDVLTTVYGYASETYELTEGPYEVRELAQSGWTTYNIICDGFEGSHSYGSLPGGVGADFTMHEGDDVTCHFYNSYHEDSNESYECSDDIDNDDDNDSDYNDDDCHTDGDASDDDETYDPRDDDEDGDNGGSSGGRAGNRGSVLGASTQCNLLITEFMRMGAANNPDQVKRLQEFLNQEMLSGLPLTGLFGPLTDAAVKAFQIKYADKVLAPWVGLPGSGIEHATDATGYVYMSTAWMINEIVCPEGNPFFPDLTNETNAPVQ